MRSIFVTCWLLLAALLGQTAAVQAAGTADASPFAARVLDLTNAERQKAGLAPLALSTELANAAQNYSQVLATTGCFEHTCGPLPNFVDRDAQAGYTDWTSIGENIAAGYPTPEAVVAGWMASPGHRANILSADFTEIGIGMTSGGGKFGTYWTQEFGSRPAVPAATVDDGSDATTAGD
jgi:uncharacterized protein YkwD